MTVVHNWVDESVLRPVAPNGRLRSVLGLGADEVLGVHAGNQGEAQALGHWVAAMAGLGDLPHLHLLLLGTGTPHVDRPPAGGRVGLPEARHFPPRSRSGRSPWTPTRWRPRYVTPDLRDHAALKDPGCVGQ